MNYSFLGHILDTDRQELLYDGQPVPLEPLTYRLIQFLLENRDQVVTKNFLLAEIWRGRSVTDWAISAAIKSARIALGDTQPPRRFIRTIHATGFRFLAPVEQDRLPTQNLTLLIRPFDIISPDEGQDYFADGLNEDLITDLSGVEGLRVSTRHISQLMKSGQLSLEDAITRLGVTHILDGVVRRERDMVRVSAQLVSVTSDIPLWAERYTRQGSGVFDLQDALCARIVNSLSLHVSARRGRTGTQNPLAYDCCLRGRSEYFRYTPQNMAAALKHFEQAAQLDPNYAEAIAYQAYCRTSLFVFAWPGSDATLDTARNLAKHPIELDPGSAVARARLGWTLGFLGQKNEAISTFEAALQLDNKNAEVLHNYGETLNRLGMPERALVQIDRAMRIETFVPPSWEFALAYSHVLKKNYAEALERLLLVLDRVPMFMPARVQLARLYSEVGETQKAAQVVATIKDNAPRYQLANAQRMFPYPQAEEARRLAEALRAAGLPE